MKSERMEVVLIWWWREAVAVAVVEAVAEEGEEEVEEEERRGVGKGSVSGCMSCLLLTYYYCTPSAHFYFVALKL